MKTDEDILKLIKFTLENRHNFMSRYMGDLLYVLQYNCGMYMRFNSDFEVIYDLYKNLRLTIPFGNTSVPYIKYQQLIANTDFSTTSCYYYKSKTIHLNLTNVKTTLNLENKNLDEELFQYSTALTSNEFRMLNLMLELHKNKINSYVECSVNKNSNISIAEHFDTDSYISYLKNFLS